MTIYSEIVTVLDNADKPLSGKEVADRIDANKDNVYRKLRSMADKNKVFRDENYEGGYSVMYQLRKEKVSHLI